MQFRLLENSRCSFDISCWCLAMAGRNSPFLDYLQNSNKTLELILDKGEFRSQGKLVRMNPADLFWKKQICIEPIG